LHFKKRRKNTKGEDWKTFRCRGHLYAGRNHPWWL
jgi:hypothetical protein